MELPTIMILKGYALLTRELLTTENSGFLPQAKENTRVL